MSLKCTKVLNLLKLELTKVAIEILTFSVSYPISIIIVSYLKLISARENQRRSKAIDTCFFFYRTLLVVIRTTGAIKQKPLKLFFFKSECVV